jgi:hypothetical protein
MISSGSLGMTSSGTCIAAASTNERSLQHHN